MITRETKNQVYERDGHKCKICGSSWSLTIDHIQPKSKGGSEALYNLQTLCFDCNQKKGDKYDSIDTYEEDFDYFLNEFYDE